MPTMKLELPAHYSSLIILGIALALGSPAALSQDAPLQRTALTLVQVNITTETKGEPESVRINGTVIPNYTPIVIEQFPSTGIVIDDKGHVVTFLGYRWVKIRARNPRVEIVDAQGQKLPGRLVGIDQSKRLAVVHCLKGELKKTPVCERCEIESGATVLLPLPSESRIAKFENAQIVSVSTAGDASQGVWTVQVSRPLSLIGEPLLNSRSQVLGIVAEQEVQADPSSVRVTITPLTVSQLLNSANKIIKANGDIQSGWLGVWVNLEDQSGVGAAIEKVDADSPAQKSGLLPGDVMLKWNGTAISDPLKYIQIVENSPIGSKAVIDVMRQGKPIQVIATIEARKTPDPDEPLYFSDISALPGAGIAGQDTNTLSVYGIETLPLTPQLADIFQISVQTGLLVSGVEKQAAFESAGILKGDIILSVDGRQVSDPQKFYDEIKSKNLGNSLVLRLMRKGVTLIKTVHFPSRKDKDQ